MASQQHLFTKRLWLADSSGNHFRTARGGGRNGVIEPILFVGPHASHATEAAELDNGLDWRSLSDTVERCARSVPRQVVRGLSRHEIPVQVITLAPYFETWRIPPNIGVGQV